MQIMLTLLSFGKTIQYTVLTRCIQTSPFLQKGLMSKRKKKLNKTLDTSIIKFFGSFIKKYQTIF